MNQIIFEEHYGVNVWTNKEMDELRKTECLCFNCDVGYCKIANGFYNDCKFNNTAIMITRCPNFIQKCK
jgi:hypothetical protein